MVTHMDIGNDPEANAKPQAYGEMAGEWEPLSGPSLTPCSGEAVLNALEVPVRHVVLAKSVNRNEFV